MSAATACPASVWLSRAPLDTSATVFFIGKDEASLRAELSRRNWHGRIVTVPPPVFAVSNHLTAPIVADAERPVIVIEPEVVRHHRDAAKEAAKQIGKAWFGARANSEAKQRNGELYRRNTLRNARTIAREADVRVLAGSFTGIAAVVIGAGPSLDRNVADIAAYRDRAILIAADTALRPLLAAGIEPDVVVEADPTETNARHLCDLPPCPNTMLVAEGSVDPESLREFGDRTFFFRVGDHEPWPWLTAQGLDCGRLKSWGSVLTTAFDLARVMGCGPIVFAGADLAFTDGRPYARGTTYEENWYQAAAWGQPIESSWSASIESWPKTHETSISGEPVRTAPHLQSFRDWIATEAEKEPGGSVINATGGGILAGRNITQASLIECLSVFEPSAKDVRSRLADAHTRGRRSGSVPKSIVAASDESWRPSVPPAAAPASQPISTSSAADDGELLLESGDLLAQIEAAWAALVPRNRLHLVDRTSDASGTAVRRALFAFLESRPGLAARYGRFFDPSDIRSWIDRRSVAELNPGVDRTKFQDTHAGVAARLVPLIVERLAPSSVLDLGCGAGHWVKALEEHGVAETEGVESGLSHYLPTRRYDVALCLGVAHRVAMADALQVVDAATKASDTVVFSVPALGVGAPGFINERSWRAWHQLFLDRGFAPYDGLRPLIEERFGRFATPFDLAIVYRRVAARGDDIPVEVRRTILESASRADDLVLQRHWHVNAMERQAEANQAQGGPRVTYVDFLIDPARMTASTLAGERQFRYRSTAASLARLTRGVDVPHVTEDGVMIPCVLDDGAIRFRSSDRSDPRSNGRRYIARVPAHVAWLESQPIGTITEHHL